MSKIDRRNFLRTFSSTFAAIAISPTQAIATSHELYLNRALGIALRKPSEWDFGTLRKFRELRQHQLLNDKIDPDLELEVRNSADPLVVFGIDCGSDLHFAPGGALYAEHIELFEHERFDDLIPNSEKIYQSILKDYRITDVKPGLLINGFESIRLESVFIYETDKISPIQVRNVSIVTRRHPFMYTLRLFDSPSNSMDAKTEFEETIHSLYYS